MKYSKTFLRNKFLLERKKKYLIAKKFNFNLIFKLIKKKFHRKKIIIAGYYPSYYEVNILKFLEDASKKNFKIALPVVKSATKMSFKLWSYREPLHVNNFGILEPKPTNQDITPDLTLVPLVAFDKKLNRIGYGKGYYDRSLKEINKIKKNKLFLGVAYSFQKCKKIPVNNNDFKLDYIFTERGIINSNN
tara:strand:+ start:800 stop:1369 length:570 start_codon:yes stop_codon:yes gene_type:complete